MNPPCVEFLRGTAGEGFAYVSQWAKEENVPRAASESCWATLAGSDGESGAERSSG